jgi:hypothetical protein
MDNKNHESGKDTSSSNVEKSDSKQGTVPTREAARIVEENINEIKPDKKRGENNDQPDNKQYPHK